MNNITESVNGTHLYLHIFIIDYYIPIDIFV